MIGVLALLFVGVVTVAIMVMLALREWTLSETGTDAWLRSGSTQTVTYVVPDGQDPAPLMAALARGGYVSEAVMKGGTERLLVACDDQHRSQVRAIIENVGRTGIDGRRRAVERVALDGDPPELGHLSS